ncbi:MAG TPA: carboxymuconolactone decarboxylase family protein [Bryobacteraceae bacterium]|jgi:alkylhydroperoxidase family enzyme|nr:carboxymuconolactone decarboxylase family protein [Bryobacteraceae bacterium]
MLNWKRLLIASVLLVIAQPQENAQRVSSARIQPLEAKDWTDAQREMLGPMARDEKTLDVFKTCLRNPDLCRPWMQFALYVLSDKNTLPPRDKEVLILRTSWLCRTDYDWAHHVPRAKAVGLTDEEIQRIPQGANARGWSRFDAVLLRAADELHTDQFIKDATWKGLAERYNERQLMDAVFTVGQYTMVSMFLNSAGVQMEPGFTGLPK